VKQLKTLKVRVKDKHVPLLNIMASNVNFVWNYINELSHKSIRDKGNFLSSYDIQKYTQGVHKELGLHSHTVQKIGANYTLRRNQFRKSKLAWRISRGSRKSLGWVPFNTGAVKYKKGKIIYNGGSFGVWDSYGLGSYELRSGSFNEDSRGRWYLNVVVEVEVSIPKGQDKIGLDLGLKDTVTCSDGTKLEAGRFYRNYERKLATAQRARNKKRAKNIHAKIANRRKDALHKFSRGLVDRAGEIYVGDVKSSSLTKTKMAKSVNDAGWHMLKVMLKYKCDNAGIIFKEVNEAYTTQTCSSCGIIPSSSPKGRAGLRIREWTCECGVTHDRDVNAARNILAVGHGRPVEGILSYKEDVKGSLPPVYIGPISLEKTLELNREVLSMEAYENDNEVYEDLTEEEVESRLEQLTKEVLGSTDRSKFLSTAFQDDRTLDAIWDFYISKGCIEKDLSAAHLKEALTDFAKDLIQEGLI